MLSARLPGVRFETRLQPVPETLPRMDIAAFVGFASAGPLHVPVAIEDPGRFREIYGDDPPLAWDGQAGRLSRGALGGCVESFFANGGRRCWVVRVADAESAVRHRFRVPGLRIADDPTAADVEARARAMGSWCEWPRTPSASPSTPIPNGEPGREPRSSNSFAVGTQLLREVQPLLGTDGGPSLELAAGAYRIDLESEPDRFETGELVEVVLAAELPRLWLFVDRVERREGYTSLVGSSDVSGSHTHGAFWVRPPALLSPAGELADGLEEVDEAVALDALSASGALDWPGSPVHPLPSVRRLRFDLLVWRGSRLLARLGELAFARAHPRCWAQLPTDEVLYGIPSGTRPAREPLELDAEARSPRFPLAGPEDDLDDLPEFYLPIEMADRRDVELAVELDDSKLVGTSLERDGLGSFDAAVFLDERLARLSVGGLLGEAEHHFYVRGRDLDGLHSLLPVEEVSLISAPDCHHRGWTRQTPELPDLLQAPELEPLREPDEHGLYELTWSEVPGAASYRLERAGDAEFAHPTTLYEGAELSTTTLPPADCRANYYFRVRAFRDGEASPWSNVRIATLPEAVFEPCSGRPPSPLRLGYELAESPASELLSWENEQPGAPAADSYELEESTNTDFVGAERLTTSETSFAVQEARGGYLYYRVRALGEAGAGPWSNTVVVPPSERTAWTLLPAGEYDDTHLLAIQRGLVRFAAARRDLLAVLSLPPHYRSREALVHVGRLTPGGDDDLVPESLGGVVPPLTEGESPALSYAALYHPWLTVRGAEASEEGLRITRAAIGSVPPDGAVVGSIAALTIDRGAWLAPANIPLARALDLEPSFDLEAWKQLVPLRVNLITRQPEGFVLLSADTLSRSASLVPVHVRRLLMLLARLARREGDRYVFRPHDANFRHLVRQRFENVLADMYRRGAYAGADPASAYRVVADEAVNPPQSVERGRFIIELRVAPVRELAFITVRLVAEEKGRLTVEEV